MSAAAPAALDVRADIGGGVCVLCKVCADHELPHACITQPGPVDAVLRALPRDERERLLAQLAAHPARPLNERRERRGVDHTWCVCGCTTKDRQ